MGMDDAGGFRFDQRGGNFLSCQLSRKYMHSPVEQVEDTAMSSLGAFTEAPPSMANPSSSAGIADHLLVNDWNLFASMPEHVGFTGSAACAYSADVQGNQQKVSSSSGSLIDQIQSRLHFSRESISEIVNSFGLSEDLKITDALGPTALPASDKHGIGKDSKGKKRKMQEGGASDSQSKPYRTQTAETGHKKDALPGSIKGTDKDVHKPKGEQNAGAKTHKFTSKQAKENSSNVDTPEEDYVHVRAKRGQATNSHSLAERLRREKISERMRFLQDLVPGCSKITGKAVMLDEIINYVQSLQRQVEFLSMKLATVSPELNYDIEQMLSKDIFLLQAGGSAVLRFSHGLGTSYHQFQQPIQQGLTQFEVENNPNPGEVLKHTLPHISATAQIPNVWDEDLQNVMQMGFIPSAQLDANSQQPGSTKIEQ